MTILTDICLECGETVEQTFWDKDTQEYLCASCMRDHHPPYMTLIKFKQGSHKMMWNVEVGQYEEISEVDYLVSFCGWIVRSKQETLYKLIPRVSAEIYHMEYYGDVKCGRCVDYKYFDTNNYCLSTACSKIARPFRKKSDRDYPPSKSRYVKWMENMGKLC